jgi:hypothetical protein
MATKVFKRLNDASVRETWAPVLEGYGVDLNARPWLVDYAHNHAIFENAGAINEAAVAPGLFFQQPGSISSMGAIAAPTNAMTPFTAGGVKTTGSGSGDKFPSLMPVAIQVAAKTIGFDLVGVVPMDSPVGFLPYLDYVYQGGSLGSEYEPYLIKIAGFTAAEVATFAAGSNYTIDGDGAGTAAVLTLQYVGASRVDGDPIFKVISSDETLTLATYIAAGNVLNSITLDAANVVSLVSALENHISGFTSVSDADYATTDFNGPFADTTGNQSAFGMTREAAEQSKFRQMGLRMFTKFIEAKGDQVAISASVEQIQDLNRVWNFDVISMLENVAVNELAQSINKKLVDRVAQLGAAHATKANAIEGVGATLASLVNPVGAADAFTLSANQRKVVTKILEIANLIYHRGRFGAGTFVVTNGRIASALADVSGYVIAPFNNDLPAGAGQLYPAGKVYGLTVYVDPNMKFNDNRIIIGRKGADEEPGVKFLPYIMAESLQTISEGTFSPKIGMKSRYAITEAGWHPETQYFTLNVTSPEYLIA